MAIIEEIPAKSILSKSNLPVADYSANPYLGCEHACKYCYACFMKRFANHPEPWGEYVGVKDWPAIKNPSKFSGKGIMIGSVTDPYQPAEEKFRRTRRLLEELKGSGCRLVTITKSDLILRDLDIIKSFPDARVAWSINSLDQEFVSQMDKGAPVAARLAAMKTFFDAGVHTTCFISPIFPGITNPQAIILAAKNACDLVWLENLNLRGGYKQTILDFIREKYPNLMELYRRIYVKGDKSYWHELDREMARFASAENLAYLRNAEPDVATFDRLPVIINYFFHEEVVRK